eukprot:3275460-Rhodomonas_salina.3
MVSEGGARDLVLEVLMVALLPVLELVKDKMQFLTMGLRVECGETPEVGCDCSCSEQPAAASALTGALWAALSELDSWTP